MKKIILIVLCMCCLMTSCKKKEPQQVEITFIHGWGSTEKDHQTMRSIYMDFEKKHPDIKLNMLSMPTNGEMIEKVKDMLTVGKIPNLIFTAGEGEKTIYRYMTEKGMLVDLLPYINADKEFAESLSPIIEEMWTSDNHLYTVSDVLFAAGGYWINKRIMDEAGIEKIPETWDEFYEMLSRINLWAEEAETGIETIRPSTDAYLYMADNILYGKGEQLKKGSMNVSGEAFGNVCDMWSKIYDNVSLNSQQFSYRDETELFNNGRLAIYVNGVWAASMIKEEIDAVYALLPSDSGKTVSCQAAGLGYLVGNVSDKEQIDASIEFIKYMCSLPVQTRILTETQQLPQNPNVKIFDYSDNLQKFCQAVGEVQRAEVNLDIPKNLWSEKQWSTIENMLPGYFGGKISREQFYKMCVKK